MTQRFLFLFALLLAAPLFGSCTATQVLECEGECTCDDSTRTCSCAGGTACVLEGADDVTFRCEGNASCDLACGVGCHVICPGTTGCTTVLGDDSSAECQGNATCNFTCEGDCEISCGGASTCEVTCADDCELEGTSCRC